MQLVVPNVEFGNEAQPLPTHEHDVAKGRGTSGLQIGASKDISAEVLPIELIRVPLELLTINAKLGELLTNARVQPLITKRPQSYCSGNRRQN